MEAECRKMKDEGGRMKDEKLHPSNVKFQRRIPDAVWAVIRELMLGQTRTALARLKEIAAEEEFRLSHARRNQIARVEAVFRVEAGRPAWPADLSPSDLIHWRGTLGGLLAELPLGRVIEDLTATAQSGGGNAASGRPRSKRR
ncbi:MAG: hypothetical protein PHI18_07895 [bacterium]|nr:hypothetical protein [bacterium]